MTDSSVPTEVFLAGDLDQRRLDLEVEKLKADERHRSDQIALERYRIRTVSVAG